MDRFYHAALQSESQRINLSVSESQHMVKVLRKKIGSQVEIINGKGGIATAEIQSLDPKGCGLWVYIYKQLPPASYSLHIAIAPTKSNDRFEWFLEKATEIGVQHITPLLCTNSERRKINLERWQRIILSATKQSKQVYKPLLNPLTPFPKFINQHTEMLIAHCHDKPKKELHTIPFSTNPCCILIGPEGDFTQEEIDQAINRGAQAIQLGSNRLRTETAGMVATHTWRLLADIAP